ncbi:MAG: exonuclease SbcCD subunit D C-terminal domain-containing protein [Euryarchaeota archaeon]|nr:exonuclease SbcCD subunit D C-terminal domain-containing protein [Euryarchaeota archaeon]
MKILHTSDWHIGHNLYGRSRYEEFEAFFDWLIKCINEEGIEAIIVSGDIFDTTNPSNRSLGIYYNFLRKLSETCCSYAIITGGNHDSPSLLDAPGEILRCMNLYVFGAVTGNISDHIIVLNNSKGIPAAVVCAVPYLRDRDIRRYKPGQNIEEKGIELMNAMGRYYQDIAGEAEKIVQDSGYDLPVIATGHLFAAGGMTAEGDGVRDLYVGKLSAFSPSGFPEFFDYVALGHLHMPQKSGSEYIRYSGAPLPLGFGEAKRKKIVIRADFSSGKTPVLKEIPVPCFMPLITLQGNIGEITEGLRELLSSGEKCCVEIIYEGRAAAAEVNRRVTEMVKDSSVEILRIKNMRVVIESEESYESGITLEDLDVNEVLRRCLAINDVPEEDYKELSDAYSEILEEIYEGDHQAE